jgi:hypothetical protein
MHIVGLSGKPSIPLAVPPSVSTTIFERNCVSADFRSILATLRHYPFSGFLDKLSRYLAAISEAFSRDKKEDAIFPEQRWLYSLPVNRMHVNAQPDFTESFSFTWHSFYLSKSGSAIRFLERTRDRW